MKMTKTNLIVCAVLMFGATAFGSDGKNDATFKNVVQHIESHYHAHRSHGFLMGFAGLMVKSTQSSGVRDMKMAIFEDQNFSDTGSDTKFDEVVRAALDHGWQPLVQSYSRHSGEHSYIYAQYAGKDMKLLLVTLESSEAVVMQIRIDPDHLSEFVNDHNAK
ncbi:MAG TPA: hypothetical protein VKT33_02530 [Candidatus Angelobacter sp.]|nr:hypothetical protein [Candidatus Angelobacter sp.]